MEYNRIVAYLYRYQNGIKGENAGFIKAEVRQGIFRMQINLNKAEQGVPFLGVNLFYRDKENICGIYLGEMELHGQNGLYRYAGPVCNIESNGVEFNKISGIYIAPPKGIECCFASEWDDMGFAPDKVLGEEEWKNRTTVVVGNDFPEPVFEVAEVEENEEYVGENKPDIWERFFDGRDKKMLFSDDDLYDCVEIAPDDIEKMPDTNWALRNNSFLNHGYYNFRHLIAGKIYRKDGCGYFIGVPGIYTRRDRNTANMFGFRHFKFSMRPDMGLNQFGYWYRELEN